jgi:hypothetical protein
MSTLECLMTRHNELNTKYINMIHKSGFKNYDEAHLYVKTKEPELITELIKLRANIFDHLVIRYSDLKAKYDYLLDQSECNNIDEAQLYVKTKEPELITELIFLRPRIIIEEIIKNAWEDVDKFNIIDRIDAQLFKKLAECKCCNKHQLNRPTTYDTLCFPDIINECKQCDDDFICNCKCRQTMRILVTLK